MAQAIQLSVIASGVNEVSGAWQSHPDVNDATSLRVERSNRKALFRETPANAIARTSFIVIARSIATWQPSGARSVVKRLFSIRNAFEELGVSWLHAGDGVREK